MRADGRTLFELIYHKTPITLSIANPCFVLFVHVHKTYQNNLAIWALRAQMGRYGKKSLFQAKNFKPTGLVSPKAFLAIGQIAYSMQDGIICYIDKIFTVIKPYIPNPSELAK